MYLPFVPGAVAKAASRAIPPVPEHLKALCGQFNLQPEGLTCFATTLANGSRCLERKLDPKQIIRLLLEAGLARPDHMGVNDSTQALRVLDPYLKEQGVKADVQPRLSARDIRALAEGDRALPWPTAVGVALNGEYMQRFHNIERHIAEDPFQEIRYDGPAHDVLLLQADSKHVWVFDPEPALNVPGGGIPGPAHIIGLDVVEFDLFVTSGAFSRESVRLTLRQTSKAKTDEPKARPVTEQKLNTEGTK